MALIVCASFAPIATAATYTVPYVIAMRARSFFAIGFPPPAHLAPTLRGDASLARLIGVEQRAHQFVAALRAQPLQQLAGELILLVQRQAHAQAELGVVLEQRVRP